MTEKPDLEAIEERLRRATQGEWYRQEYYESPIGDHLSSYERMLWQGYMDGPDHDWPAVDYVEAIIPTRDRLDTEKVTVCIAGNGPTSRFNAEFIRNAPQDIRALLAEVARLQTAAHEYRARLTEAEAQIVNLAAACEDALCYFEQSWKQVGEHPHAVEAPYVHDLREALGKNEADNAD